MLVLSRKVGESICIGDNIEVTISRIQGSQVRISIQAPREVSIRRSELPEHSNVSAAETYRLLASEASRRPRAAKEAGPLGPSSGNEVTLEESAESLPTIVPLLARRNQLPPKHPRS